MANNDCGTGSNVGFAGFCSASKELKDDSKKKKPTLEVSNGQQNEQQQTTDEKDWAKIALATYARITGENTSTSQDRSGFGIDDAVSLGVGFTPAGVAADIYTALTGKDFFTNDDVTGLWRWAGLIPFASEARKLGNAADAAQESITAIRKVKSVVNSFDDVSDYIRKNGVLPDNFITKKDARALGWDPKKGNLQDIAPGKSIGGDIFHNSEGGLPSSNGRVWREADINYSSGYRGNDRLLYSSDGLMYKTTNHYKTFTQL
ncbi:hypothetical protein L2712_18800 [Shewanella marisflavi]|uniref:ribonuclease domain-containing protein n=1 Tax=Shewanella marisflavi TaxID=260364 RepID=UPI00200E21A2|nr:ribonuclease domain-containing protein [Shewanella marisflavi]MCL1043680.1 hypothetical protein [Shewanella marisflavi]